MSFFYNEVILGLWQIWVGLYWALALVSAICWMGVIYSQRKEETGEEHSIWALVVGMVFLLVLYPVFLIRFKKREMRESTPIFGWFWRRKYRREDEERRKRGAENRRQENEQQARIAAWHKANPPVIYWNTKDKITVAVSARAFQKGHDRTAAAAMDREWDHPGLLMPIWESYLFYEGEPPTGIPLGYFTGKLSRLKIDLARYVKLEGKAELFVPFSSEGILSFEEQMKRIEPLTRREPSDRYFEADIQSKIVRELLLPRAVPQEVVDGTAKQTNASV